MYTWRLFREDKDQGFAPSATTIRLPATPRGLEYAGHCTLVNILSSYSEYFAHKAITLPKYPDVQFYADATLIRLIKLVSGPFAQTSFQLDKNSPKSRVARDILLETWHQVTASEAEYASRLSELQLSVYL